jgi:hypothetical protein
METIKIKVKVGQHEFEAEGPSELIQSQFQDFKELIATSEKHKDDTCAVSKNQDKTPAGTPFALQPPIAPTSLYDKIMRVEGRIVSLTVRAATEQDAVLLMMLGQKTYRGNDTVTGNEIMEGLQRSGVIVPRVDRVMERLVSDGLVIRIGAHRATRYRFINQGMTRAQELANAAIASVA